MDDICCWRDDWIAFGAPLLDGSMLLCSSWHDIISVVSGGVIVTAAAEDKLSLYIATARQPTQFILIS